MIYLQLHIKQVIIHFGDFSQLLCKAAALLKSVLLNTSRLLPINRMLINVPVNMPLIRDVQHIIGTYQNIRKSLTDPGNSSKWQQAAQNVRVLHIMSRRCFLCQMLLITLVCCSALLGLFILSGGVHYIYYAVCTLYITEMVNMLKYCK